MISDKSLRKIIENVEINCPGESYSTTIWPNTEYIIDKEVLKDIVMELYLRRKGEYLERRKDYGPRGPRKGDSNYYGF